jgi:hypothetical protein
MAVCLDYQHVYARRSAIVISGRLQAATVLLLLCAFAGKVWLSNRSTDLGYQLAREQSRTVELDMKRRELELELSVLMRPDTLTKAARKSLGLLPLNPAQARRMSYE